MSDLINELINDKAVYRTAPATPGLLKIYILASTLIHFSQILGVVIALAVVLIWIT